MDKNDRTGAHICGELCSAWNEEGERHGKCDIVADVNEGRETCEAVLNDCARISHE